MNLDQLLLERRTPFARYEYVDVTFSGTADTDEPLRHTLNPARPDDVRYAVVRQDRAGSVYDDQSGSRREWTNTHIFLRASVASMKARVLLFVEK